jgi:nitrite reductase (NO-forming)
MKSLRIFLIFLIAAGLMAGCASPQQATSTGPKTIEYTLHSLVGSNGMQFQGEGGEIDGKVNPELKANTGDTVIVNLISTEGAKHDFVVDELGVKSEPVSGKGNKVTIQFVVEKPGEFKYYCSLAGHRQAGMEGKFTTRGKPIEHAAAPSGGMPAAISAPAAAAATVAPAKTDLSDVVRSPSDLPGPLGGRGPQSVRIDLETKEVDGKLADGTTFTYWTFNGQVPGPFLRVRVGDTVEVHLKNGTSSTMSHSVDFHAVTGPGGGAVFTATSPGQETMFTFKALNPGLFVYHCATPMVAQHIANGMYGLILVEPEVGLPKVDREFYVMQGEIYTTGKFGEKGHQMDSVDKLLNETPEYFVFNGAVGALTAQKPLKASVGETVRIFFGVGGPNFTSSFHVIGEIFDRVYDQASLTSPALANVQTTLVPPGGATMVDFKLEVPGRYILVDHALSRLQRGLAGYLMVEGPDNPQIFNGTPMPGSGH